MASAHGTVSIGPPAADTIVIPAKSAHVATVLFLHGLGDTGHGWADIVDMIRLPNVKWILPSAPIQRVSVNGGYPCPSWFDIFGLEANSNEDEQGIDAAAKYVDSLLAKEAESADPDAPPVSFFVGGFSQGGGLSLHLAARKAAGTFLDGQAVSSVPLSGVMCLSGWLPVADTLSLTPGSDAAARAASLPILMCHGQDDSVVQHSFGQKSAKKLQAEGFTGLQFKSYAEMAHEANPQEIADIQKWMEDRLSWST